jgi:hypothetical protein|tara:strand:+ start:3765 stop:4217 length:453 start_codon:yes stop_codon:yes gene_type:complete
MPLAEIVAVLATVNSIVDTVQKSGNHVATLTSYIGRLTDANSKINEIETRKAGKLTQKEALDIALTRKRIATAQGNITEHLKMAGLHDVLHDMNHIMTEQREEQQRQLAAAKERQRDRNEMMMFVGQLFGMAVGCSLFVSVAMFIFLRLF